MPAGKIIPRKPLILSSTNTLPVALSLTITMLVIVNVGALIRSSSVKYFRVIRFIRRVFLPNVRIETQIRTVQNAEHPV